LGSTKIISIGVHLLLHFQQILIELSSATPAGYWFLKGFEIDKIAGSVDYFNMMCKLYRSSLICND